MILLAVVIIRAGKALELVRLSFIEWGCLIAGSIITIVAYTEDYSQYMLDRFSFAEWYSFSDQTEILAHAAEYIPGSFSWWLFLSGTFLFSIAIAFFIYRNWANLGRR